jgi:S1-C subfamily serine protease
MQYLTPLFALLLTAAAALAHQATRPATQPTGGFFGARLATMDDRIADELGMDVDTGVLVGGLLPDSPAAKAGIEEHDVIQKMDGQAVADLPAFQKIIRTTRPGQEITFTVMRGNETKEIKVTLGERPANMPTPPTTRPG